MSHTCHANGCNWATERKLFMCLQHWTKLPSNLQGAVLAAYRAQPSADLRPYMTACAEAVEFIARLEHRLEENSYRRLVDRLKHQAAQQLPQMTANIQALISQAPQPARVARG